MDRDCLDFSASMNIAIIASAYPPDIKGGGELSTQLLAEILMEAGCVVNVLTCGSAEAEMIHDGVNVKRIESPNIYWDLSQKKKHIPEPSRIKKLIWHFKENANPAARDHVSRFVKDCKPDVVVTSTIENFGPEAWIAPHEQHVPCVHVLRSYWPFCWKGSAVWNGTNCKGQCIDCAVMSYGRRRASKYVSGVVGISHYILKRHLDLGLFSRAATAIIPEPIREAVLRTKERRQVSTRFGYLGVISPDKGLDTLAAAWRKANLSSATLSIAGQGREDYVASLKGAFGPHVSFKGWVDSADYLSGIDFLIVPSVWNEPFGRIVIEAFAQGVPVIGSHIGGIAETISDSQDGFTFTPGDKEQLAALITRCAELPAFEYGALSGNALSRVRSYASKAIATAHIEFYQDVLRRERVRCDC